MGTSLSDDFTERQICGALLIGVDHEGKRAVDQIGDLEPSDLTDRRYQHIMRVVKDFADEGQTAEIIGIVETLEREGNLVPAWASADACVQDMAAMMKESPNAWYAKEWADRILEKSRQRRLLTGVKALANDVANPTIAAEDIAAEFERLAKVARTGKSSRPKSSLNVVNAEDVVAKYIDWLWKNRFARGMLNYVAGDPGLGKSLVFAADVAARITVGADFPDGAPGGDPGDVVLFVAEDDTAATVIPRLKRSGADLRRVKIVESAMVFNAKSGKMEHQQFDIGLHVPLLAEVLSKLPNPLMVLIDPIAEYLGKVDSHKNGEVRGVLHPLIELAGTFNAAVVGLGHLNKGGGGKAAYRASGSLAFVAASRSFWMVGKDPENPRRRMILPAKINIAPEVAGIAYTIESDGEDEPPFVHWDGNPVDLTGDTYLELEAKIAAAKGKEGDDGELARAEQLIRQQLKDGPLPSKELDSARQANDISPSTFRRAKGTTGVRAEKEKCKPYRFWLLLEGQKIPDPPGDVALPSKGTNHDQHAQHGQQGLPLTGDGAHVDHDAHPVQRGGDEQHPPEDAGLNPDGTRKPKRKAKAAKKKATGGRPA